MAQLAGHHHITLCVGDAQEDYDFHTGVLGLKSVKKTLLYDGTAPIYHLYYGNDNGDPGTLVTTFPMRHTGVKGRPGSGQIDRLMLAIPAGAAAYWARRLGDAGFSVREHEYLGERRLDFDHPCGIGYALVEAPQDARPGCTGGGISDEVAIRGTHGISVTVRDQGLMDDFVTGGWSCRRGVDEQATTRYEMGAGGTGSIVDVLEAPDLAQGSWTFGEGTVHHCAFIAADLAAQSAIKAHVEGMGFTDCSDVKDRGYFDSVYVRTPGGALFEACVSKPEGFTIDEPREALGSALMISPQFQAQREEIIAQVGELRY